MHISGTVSVRMLGGKVAMEFTIIGNIIVATNDKLTLV